MNRTEFRQLMDETWYHQVKLSQTKGKEYSGDEDVLQNFKDVAADINVTPEQVLMTYAAKHWRAINSYTNNRRVYSESIESRINDLILYMFLYLAMIRE